ncbi:MAG: integrase [Gemmatimonadetes bacterium]|nr:integrase [Gemmatimonadota bacterium]
MQSDNRMKGVTLFPDGRWLIQKTRHKHTITRRGDGGEKAAVAALDAINAELAQLDKVKEAAKTLGLKAPRPGATLKALSFRRLFEDKYQAWAETELHSATRRSRESVHWHLLAFFGDVPLDEITSELVDAFKSKRMKEGIVYRTEEGAQKRAWRALSKAGLAEQLKVLRAILKWAVKKGHLKIMPSIEMPKDKRNAPGAGKPVRYFTLDERARLLRRSNPGLADVIRFSLTTGARPAETFHIRCRSIDLVRRTITFEEQPCALCDGKLWLPKVGTWRQIEIAPDLLPVLRRLLRGKRPDDLLFDNVHGKPYTRLQGGGGAFNRALRSAGLARQGLSFYSLRHTFGADLASAGVPLQKIGKLMGHHDLRSTQVYAHLTPEALNGIVDNLKLPDEWRALSAVPRSHSLAPALSLVGEEASAIG